MSTVWTSLGKARLQELIGPGVFSRLEGLLPALRPQISADSVYTMQSLSALFEAYSGASRMQDESFRRELFNALPVESMDSVLHSIGVESSLLGWPEKVAHLAKAWRKPEKTALVARMLDIPDDLLPIGHEQVEPEELIVPTGAPYKPLKDYQFAVHIKILDALRIPRTRFIVQMPTGSGKTRTSMEGICHILNEQPEGAIVVWLAHSEELCQQAYDCFREVWVHVATRSLRLKRAWGANADLSNIARESTMMVGSFSQFYSSLRNSAGTLERISGRTYLVVVDEAHRAAAPTYNQVLKALLGPETRTIGLTATPGRSAHDNAENAKLANIFFNKLIELEYEEGADALSMLRRRKVLAETKYHALRTSRTYELSPQERVHLAQYFDIPPSVLSRLASDDVRNVEIVRELENRCAAGSQVLFFACSVEHSKFICATLNFLGVKAAHIDGTTVETRRKSTVTRFREREIQVLCNYSLLATGFDAPKVDVVFISRPTGSIVLYSQMIGRGLRGPAIGGTAKCTIVDVIDNINGFEGTDAAYNYFTEYFGIPGGGKR